MVDQAATLPFDTFRSMGRRPPNEALNPTSGVMDYAACGGAPICTARGLALR